jgi:hypothetical protein
MALRLRLLGEAALVDEKRRLLLRLGDDPLGLFLGLLDDPLALGVDPLCGADLLGNGDAKLVDQPERRRLVDDDVVRQRQPPTVRDDRLEALDEEDDVDRSALRGVDRNGRDGRAGVGGPRCGGLSHGGAATTAPIVSALPDEGGFSSPRHRPIPRRPSSGGVDRRRAGRSAPRSSQPAPDVRRRAASAAGGIIADTSPPNVEISLTSEEAT